MSVSVLLRLLPEAWAVGVGAVQVCVCVRARARARACVRAFRGEGGGTHQSPTLY